MQFWQAHFCWKLLEIIFFNSSLNLLLFHIKPWNYLTSKLKLIYRKHKNRTYKNYSFKKTPKLLKNVYYRINFSCILFLDLILNKIKWNNIVFPTFWIIHNLVNIFLSHSLEIMSFISICSTDVVLNINFVSSNHIENALFEYWINRSKILF